MAEFVASGWEDLTPIPQYEGEDPVVQIAYPEDCKSPFYYPLLHEHYLILFCAHSCNANGTFPSPYC